MARRMVLMAAGFVPGVLLTLGVLAGVEAASEAISPQAAHPAARVTALTPGERLAGPPPMALALFQPASTSSDGRLPLIFRSHTSGW